MGNLNCGKTSHNPQKEIYYSRKPDQKINAPKILENIKINLNSENFIINQIYFSAPNLTVKNISISNKDFINKEEIKIIHRRRFYSNHSLKLNKNMKKNNFSQKKSNTVFSKETNLSVDNKIKNEQINDNCINIGGYNGNDKESLTSESKTIYNNDSKDINNSCLIEQDNGKTKIIENKNEDINKESYSNINNNINNGIVNKNYNEIDNRTIKLFKKTRINPSPLEIICESEDDKKIFNVQTDQGLNSNNFSLKNKTESFNNSMNDYNNQANEFNNDDNNLEEKIIFDFEEINKENNKICYDEKQIKINSNIETILSINNQKMAAEKIKNKIKNENKNIILNKIDSNNASICQNQLVDNNNFNKIENIDSANKKQNIINKDKQMEDIISKIKNNDNISNNQEKRLNNKKEFQEIDNSININNKKVMDTNLNKLKVLENYPQSSLLEFQNIRPEQLIFYQFPVNNICAHFYDNKNNFRYKNNNEDGNEIQNNNEINFIKDNKEINSKNKKELQIITNKKNCKNLSKNKSTKIKNKHISKKINWKDISIYSIIPKEKYMTFKETDIILQGEFIVINDLLLQNKTLSQNREKYKRYLTLAKTELKVFRNKEKYIYDENPLNAISLFNISKCDIYPITTPTSPSNNVLFNYNFYIKLTTVNGMMMKNSQINNKRNKKYSHLNKSANLPKKKRHKASLTHKIKDDMLKCFCKHKDIELINLIDNEKGLENNDTNNLRSSCKLKDLITKKENYEIIVLSSDNKKFLYTWVALINHLIK